MSKSSSNRLRGFDVAKKVQRKKLSDRDENRHLDVKKEINDKMSDLSIVIVCSPELRKLRQIASRALWKGLDLTWIGVRTEVDMMDKKNEEQEEGDKANIA